MVAEVNSRTESIAGTDPDLSSALLMLEPNLLVLRCDDLVVVSCSEGMQKLLPDLQVGDIATSTLATVSNLSKILADNPSFLTIGVVQSVTIELKGENYRCDVCRYNDDHLVLRCTRLSGNLQFMQSYMEDREKLFSLSRTISVSEMATTLAHELNQPLGTISNILAGTSARLSRAGNVDDAIVPALEKAQDQARFASAIIARIRDFTKSRQPKREPCDVLVLLKTSVDLLDWVLDKSEVCVSWQEPDSPLMIEGDATMLQQVFTNLVRNAVDAMQANGTSVRTLQLNCQVEDARVLIEVIDNGHGLDTQQQQDLFVPFATQKATGMGIGLNICRSFIELHQGRLWLSPNEQGGCTASVTLPVLLPNSKVSAAND